MSLVFESHSLRDTDRLAAGLVNHIPAGTTVALSGTLGSGKTRFVQGVGTAMGIDSDKITSPTFVLCNEHVGESNMYHLDAYRLQDSDQFLELGVDEMYQSNHYVFIEWADQVRDCLPREYIEITIRILSSTRRQFAVDATSSLNNDVVQWHRAHAESTRL